MQHCSTDVCERRVLVTHLNMFYVLIWADQRSVVPHGVAWDRITTQHIFGSGWAFGGEHSALSMSFLLSDLFCFTAGIFAWQQAAMSWIGHGGQFHHMWHNRQQNQKFVIIIAYSITASSSISSNNRIWKMHDILPWSSPSCPLYRPWRGEEEKGE